jgi:hypothetical protein
VTHPTSISNATASPASSVPSSSSVSNLKITIAGKPIESSKPSGLHSINSSISSVSNHSSTENVKNSNTEQVNSAAFANKNIFDLLQQNDSEAVEMPSTPNGSKKVQEKTGNSFSVSSIGPTKVINTSSQPQSHAELERLAREKKLDSHLTGLEESMFRTRLEAESLEAKLKMLFEASSQAKHQSRATVVPSSTSAANKQLP